MTQTLGRRQRELPDLADVQASQPATRWALITDDMPLVEAIPAVQRGPRPAARFVRTLARIAGFTRAATIQEAPAEDETDKIARFETRRYVREAPHVDNQLADRKGRTNRFALLHSSTTPTEYEGLQELQRTLRANPDKRAKSMLESLTFIGEKEDTEALATIAASWKAYLDADPEAQLCVLTYITLGKQNTKRIMKSDLYMVERILEQHFSDTDLEKYRGRLLLNNPGALTAKPEKVRVVMPDDRMISGSQIGSALGDVYERLPEQYHDRVEIQLIAASRRHWERGFVTADGRVVPVKTYFLAHQANTTDFDNNWDNDAVITSVHSTADRNFRDVIKQIVRGTKPALTRIMPPYLTNPDVPRYRRALQLLGYGGKA